MDPPKTSSVVLSNNSQLSIGQYMLSTITTFNLFCIITVIHVLPSELCSTAFFFLATAPKFNVSHFFHKHLSSFSQLLHYSFNIKPLFSTHKQTIEQLGDIQHLHIKDIGVN